MDKKVCTEGFLRTQVRRILEAEEEKKKPTKKKGPGVERGRVGRGGIKGSIRDAKAFANRDPKGLMEKLGVKTPAGNTVEEKVLSVIRQSISTADVMKQAYSGAGMESTAGGNRYVRIYPGGINARDAVLYMNHVLTGALNAGLLTGLNKRVVVGMAKIDDQVIPVVQFLESK